ncbi:MerR family transcriptional regulator [Rhizocola hellebori]|uniref:MerR family transcriptional regulator n=1 Tax=Rhizocola hellebori TaxID=1392758 RepID=A0A8J3QGP4_9ACTN|nr:MerR family transcriptional regulator [Rhizocola hellebori]GIH10769.1 MerR family transcriptional regulator [Rhizocola hellebori]
MFTIGDFASLGRVSVRMLRHYDALGLLEPARVDPFSGYRFYSAEQLSRLNRIIALKELGFTLQQVGAILDEKVDVVELRGMLRMRRAQLEHQVSTDTARLAAVNARLRLIEIEGHMNTQDVVLKSLPAMRLATLSAVAASYASSDIGPTIQPLYKQLLERVTEAGVMPTGSPVAYYTPANDDGAVTVVAGFTVSAQASPEQRFDIAELPAVPRAAALIHHGSLENADETYQALAKWIEDNGYRADGAGYAREVYLDTPMDDISKWVTEMQIVLLPDSDA